MAASGCDCGGESAGGIAVDNYEQQNPRLLQLPCPILRLQHHIRKFQTNSGQVYKCIAWQTGA